MPKVTPFLWFDSATRRLSFAGARLPLFQLDPQQPAVLTIDGDRMGVGYVDTPLDYEWTNQVIDIAEGSLLFLTTDGLIALTSLGSCPSSTVLLLIALITVAIVLQPL